MSSAHVPSARTPFAQVPGEQVRTSSANNETIVPHRPGTTEQPPIIGDRDLSAEPNPPVRPANRSSLRQKNLTVSNGALSNTAADGIGGGRRNLDEIEIDKKAIGYIYGSGHGTINRLRKQSGASILIQESQGGKAIVQISGTDAERRVARNGISELVHSWTSLRAGRVEVKSEP